MYSFKVKLVRHETYSLEKFHTVLIEVCFRNELPLFVLRIELLHVFSHLLVVLKLINLILSLFNYRRVKKDIVQLSLDYLRVVHAIS